MINERLRFRIVFPFQLPLKFSKSVSKKETWAVAVRSLDIKLNGSTTHLRHSPFTTLLASSMNGEEEEKDRLYNHSNMNTLERKSIFEVVLSCEMGFGEFTLARQNTRYISSTLKILHSLQVFGIVMIYGEKVILLGFTELRSHDLSKCYINACQLGV